MTSSNRPSINPWGTLLITGSTTIFRIRPWSKLCIQLARYSWIPCTLIFQTNLPCGNLTTVHVEYVYGPVIILRCYIFNKLNRIHKARSPTKNHDDYPLIKPCLSKCLFILSGCCRLLFMLGGTESCVAGWLVSLGLCFRLREPKTCQHGLWLETFAVRMISQNILHCIAIIKRAVMWWDGYKCQLNHQNDLWSCKIIISKLQKKY